MDRISPYSSPDMGWGEGWGAPLEVASGAPPTPPARSRYQTDARALEKIYSTAARSRRGEEDRSSQNAGATERAGRHVSATAIVFPLVTPPPPSRLALTRLRRRLKKFLRYLLHRMFRYIHEILNIVKKITKYTI